MITLSELVLILSVSAVTAAIGTFVLIALREKPLALPDQIEEPMMMLFDDGVLHHATQSAQRNFAIWPGTHVWTDFRRSLMTRFPDLPEEIGIGASGQMTVRPAAKEDGGRLEITWRDRMCWITLEETGTRASQTPHPLRSGNPEHLCCASMTDPVWQPGENGKPLWQNQAATALLQTLMPEDADRLLAAVGADSIPRRIALRTREDEHLWFSLRRETVGETSLCHASSVTALVEAETAQHRFVQTLADTFAHLPIGLAIFDRNGQLRIFNPALVDLTGLSSVFLASRPKMLSFFDQLRENRHMPEPKNYRSWRQDITDLIAKASGGEYSETWTLEDGRTFAVQGRMHPDGSTAFLIEDISPEITLTRNFRTELEQYEALIDSVEDGFAIFSSPGILTFCNAAYRQMFDHSPETAFSDTTVQDAIGVWQSRLKQPADWRQVTRFVGTLGPRARQTLDLVFHDGTPLACRMEYLSADASIIRFSKGARAVSAEVGTNSPAAV